VGIAVALKHQLIVGARSFAGKPHSGHTLHEQLMQSSFVMRQTEHEPLTACVDMGCQGCTPLWTTSVRCSLKNAGTQHSIKGRIIKWPSGMSNRGRFKFPILNIRFMTLKKL